MLIRKDQILILSMGEYSGYTLLDALIAQADFDTVEVLRQYADVSGCDQSWELEYELTDNFEQFRAWFERSGLVKLLNLTEFNISGDIRKVYVGKKGGD